MAKDYQSLKMHFFDILRSDDQHQPAAELKKETEDQKPLMSNNENEEHELSLCLGTRRTTSSCSKKEEENSSTNKGGLALGLELKLNEEYSSSDHQVVIPERSVEAELKEKEIISKTLPPSKVLKSSTTTRSREEDDQLISQQQNNSAAKRARVSLRARCGDPTIYDGCQWRKYGQKIAKGNPCPRAYYRCSVADNCPVRKQVQRCADDTTILITTYEGIHNHPLPSAATAMASTTSAAACMLLSGSNSTSSTTITTTSTGLHGLNGFNLPSTSNPSRPVIMSSTPASSSSHPTVTLDLTSPFQSSTSFSITPGSSYASRSFNFPSLESSAIAAAAGSYPSSCTEAVENQQHNISRSLSFERIQKASSPTLATLSSVPEQSSLTDTIAKAITSDPGFQTALAAAITSYVGGRGVQGESGESGFAGNGAKWGEFFAGGGNGIRRSTSGQLSFSGGSARSASGSPEKDGKPKAS